MKVGEDVEGEWFDNVSILVGYGYVGMLFGDDLVKEDGFCFEQVSGY